MRSLSAPTPSTEFIVPENLEVTVGETFQYGVIPNVAPAGTTVEVVNIFLTAKVQSHEVERYRALGAAGVIPKPFDPMTFPDEIRRLLETKP